jgi:hypothetical protein
MADISDAMQFADSKPEEAADHIAKASIFNIEPQAYKQYKEELNAEYDKKMRPSQAEPSVDQYSRQSTEHASLAKDDVDHLNWFERQARMISDYVGNRMTTDRKVSELAFKKMNFPDQFSDDDQIALDNANFDRDAISRRNYGLDGPFEQLPAKIAGGLTSMVAGAGEGSQDTFGKIISKLPLAGPGLALGYGFYKDAFVGSTGATYNELSHVTNDKGEPLNLDETTKKKIAYGVGVVSLGLQAAGGSVLTKAEPYVASFMTPRLAKSLILNPGYAAGLKTVLNIADSGVSLAGIGAANELSRIVGQEMAQGYDGTEASFWNALATTAEKLKDDKSDYRQRLTDAAVTGGATGVLAGTAFGALGYKNLKEVYTARARATIGRMNERVAGTRDVTPAAPEMLGERPGGSEAPGSGEPSAPSPVDQSVKVLQLRTALENMDKVAGQTKMSTIAPSEMSAFQRLVFNNAGLKRVWIARDEFMEKFKDKYDDPERGAKLRQIVDPNGVASAPVPIEPHKFMELVKEFPEALDLLRIDPNGPSTQQAKPFLEGLGKAEQKRQEIFQRLGVNESKPVEPSKEKPLTGEEIEAHVRRAGEIQEQLQKPEPKIEDVRAGEIERIKALTEGGELWPNGETRQKDLPEEVITLKNGQQFAIQGSIIQDTNTLHPSGVPSTSATIRVYKVGGQWVKDKIGELHIGNSRTKSELFGATSVGVNNLNLRRQGMASAMYDYAEKHGMKMTIGGTGLTPDSFAFWNNRIEKKGKNQSVFSRDFKPASNRDALNAELEQIKTRIQSEFTAKPGAAVEHDWTNSPEDLAAKAEHGYMHEPTFTEAIRKALPNAEVTRFDEAQMRARESEQSAIKQAAKDEMLSVRDVENDIAMQIEREQALQSLEYDPNFAIVDKFTREVVSNAKGRRPISVYAIDPKFLTKEQYNKYHGDLVLKEHGVFAKGGYSPDESARQLGVSSGDELLSILSKTPAKEKVVQAIMEANRPFVEAEVAENVGLDHNSVADAFNDSAARHLAEMKFMREQEWPATKAGIKRIALPLPKMRDLEIQARTLIAKTPLQELNVHRFRVGERQAMRKAVNAILKNEVNTAFVAKEAATLNALLAREAAVKVAKINRTIKFAKQFVKADIQAIFKEAGSQFVNAINEILDVFNFDPRAKGTAKPGSFLKLAEHLKNQGAGDIQLPEDLSDIRQSVNDMTVEQFEAVTGVMHKLLHEAKMVNKIYGQMKKKQKQWTVEMTAEKLHEQVVKHPDYNPDKKVFIQETKPVKFKIQAIFRDGFALFTNMENVLRQADGGVPNGLFQETFMHRLKGDGKYDKLEGWSKEYAMHQALDHAVRERITHYGEKEFYNLHAEILDIEEFKDAKALNYGQLTKGDLMVMWAYKGDPLGYEKLANNHGVSIETIEAVLDKYLEPKDVELTQNLFPNLFANYKDETAVLQKEFGHEVEFVKPRPNMHRGKEYPGGYVPNNHIADFYERRVKDVEQAVEQQVAAFFGNRDLTDLMGKQRAAEMTDQHRLINRVGSDLPLDFSFTRMIRAHEEHIHDLSYRRVVRDLLRLFREPQIRDDLVNVVGEQKYRLAVNTVIETANRPELQNAELFSDQGRFMRNLIRGFIGNFNVAVLGFNPTSVAVQFSAVAETLQFMGKTGPKYYVLANKKIISNPTLWDQFFKEAVRLDPTVGHFVEQLQGEIASTLVNLMPTKGGVIPKNVTQWAKRGHEQIINSAMFGMSAADAMIKMVSAHALYAQFINGDAPNYPLKRLQNMTEEEIDQAAQAYVRQGSRLALTHNLDMDKAPFQKMVLSELFANFWADNRNRLNNMVNQGRKIGWEANKVKKIIGKSNAGAGKGPTRFDEMRDSDWNEAKDSGQRALHLALGIIAIASTSLLMEDYVRGRSHPFDKNHPLRDVDDFKNMMTDATKYMLYSPIRQSMETTPIFRDIEFAVGRKPRFPGDDIKSVNIPLISGLTYVATGAGGLADLFYGDGHLSPKQKQALWYSGSLLGLKYPVNGPLKIAKAIENYNRNIPPVAGESTIDKLRDAIKQWKSEPPKGASEELKKSVDKLEASITPANSAVPDSTYVAMKKALSGGNWSKVNEETGAAGVYQFTEKQWNDIRTRAPELALTDNGRVSQDSAQQEKAIRWESQSNAKSLVRDGIPVDADTLLAAHVLGADETKRVYAAAADKKVKGFINSSTLSQNPDLSKFKTVGQIRKHFKSLVQDNRLTSSDGNTED